MHVIIAGAGEVGGHAADVLSSDGVNVTVIDLSAERLQGLSDRLDLRTLVGHCAHYKVLKEAGVEDCDLMICATQVDEINLLSAFVAKTAGAAKTMVRVHHTANFSLRGTAFAAKLGIDELICPEHLTSLAIARTVRNPGSIALEEFGRGKLLMQRFPVTDNAPAIGKTLKQMQLPANTRAATIERGGEAKIADAGTLISSGDIVTLIGERDTFDSARKLFNKGKEKRRHIAITGETPTAVWLCRALKSRVFSVRLFVENRARAEELAEKLPHVTVLEGDPTDMATFNDEHIEKTDAFIAVGDDDEHNILACAQAKALGVATAIVVVQRVKYRHLFPHVGIDHTFSPREVAVGAIRQLTNPGPVRSIASFAQGIAGVYEIRPSSKGKCIGKALKSIKLPTQCMIAAVRRGDNVYCPGANDEIQEGETVLVIGPTGVETELRELFVS